MTGQFLLVYFDQEAKTACNLLTYYLSMHIESMSTIGRLWDSFLNMCSTTQWCVAACKLSNYFPRLHLCTFLFFSLLSLSFCLLVNTTKYIAFLISLATRWSAVNFFPA